MAKNIKEQSPKKGKEIRDSAVSYDRQTPVFRFDMLDRNGLFAFDIHRDDFNHKLFLDKLISYGNMTWSDIKRQTHDEGRSKNHYLSEEKLSDAAWERIHAKHLEDRTDIIFSLALENLLRVIGLLENGVFQIIWYDPNHMFCPSRKK